LRLRKQSTRFNFAQPHTLTEHTSNLTLVYQQNGTFKTLAWSHTHTNKSQGKRKSSSKPQGPKKASPIALGIFTHPRGSHTNYSTEGEAPDNLSMPLLQPREIRLRLH
jgi:hypothetical protein